MKSSQRPLKGTAPEQTFHDRVVLTWNRDQSTKNIPLDHVNVATFHLASGFNRFSLYCQEAKLDTEQEDLHPSSIAETAALIEDDEADEVTDPDFVENMPKATSFDLDGQCRVITFSIWVLTHRGMIVILLVWASIVCRASLLELGESYGFGIPPIFERVLEVIIQIHFISSCPVGD